ncbi:MAG: DUF4402 domain-containing protein, partial [Pseudomonadota bacterium]
NFGTIVGGSATGSATINVAGARTAAGGITLVTGAGLEQQGIITVSGSTGFAIDLSMSATSFILDNGAGDSMTVDSFNVVVSDGTPTRETITLGTTTETYSIGATLRVGINQPGGTYTGTYGVVANYQ